MRTIIAALTLALRASPGLAAPDVEPGDIVPERHPLVVTHHSGGVVTDVWRVPQGVSETPYDRASATWSFYDARGNWVRVGGDVTLTVFDVDAVDRADSGWGAFRECHLDREPGPCGGGATGPDKGPRGP